MTYSGDFTGDDFGAAPAYPNIFGITFTPTVSGAICAVAGLAVATYMFLNLVQPAADQVQTLQNEVTTKQQQYDQQQQNLRKVQEAKEKLEVAKQRKADVLNLFSTDRSLNTLLLDINRELTKPGRQVTINSFTPVGPPALLSDDTLGPGVKGKLKTQQITLAMEGTFPQLQGVIRTIERLQSLIIFRNFTATRDGTKQKFLIDPRGRLTTTGEAILKTSVILQVVVAPTDAPAPTAPPGAPAATPAAK